MTGHGLRILMGPTMSTESHVTDFEPQNRTCEESWKRGGPQHPYRTPYLTRIALFDFFTRIAP